MAKESRSNLESGLISSGNSFAAGRIGARYTEIGAIGQQMGGVSYLDSVRNLVTEAETNWDAVLGRLRSMQRKLLARDKMVVNLSGDNKLLEKVSGAVSDFVGSFPETGEQTIWTPALGGITNEAFVVPTQVNYVAKGFQVYQPGEKVDGSSAVISRFLRTAHLWDKVRVMGGAYGANIGFDQFTGMITFSSYRDPNLISTLAAYDETGDFLRQLEMPPDELVKSVIGAVGGMDQPMTADQKGFASMVRHLSGITTEFRQQWREEVLGTTAKHFKDFAERVDAVKDNGSVAIVGSEASVAVAKDEIALDVVKLL